LFREFKPPKSEPWVTTDQVNEDRHERRIEALLAETNQIDGDYARVQGPGARLARNHVSFGKSGDSYEYVEVILDPNSPFVALRQVIEVVERHYGAVAERAARSLTGRRLTAADIRDAYREHCIAPMRRAVAAGDRPILGPAEWQAIRSNDHSCDKDVEAALLARSPGDPEPIHDALEEAGKALPFDEELLKLGWLAYRAFDAESWDDDAVDITFHATIVMPAPIVRANTCYQGDTARWDFKQEDLYGRGFEMRVRATSTTDTSP
jgi:hypothetical protein